MPFFGHTVPTAFEAAGVRVVTLVAANWQPEKPLELSAIPQIKAVCTSLACCRIKKQKRLEIGAQ